MLHCDDFSDEIAAHRLWLAWGRNWTEELDQLFNQYPGFAVPAQFIRAGGADTSAADNLIPISQKIFHGVSERRSDEIRRRREGWRAGVNPRKVCVIAPSHFRLWDGSGTALAEVLRGTDELETADFDSDDPLSASSLALAAAASKCGAILAPGVARADLPDVAAREMPWITWVVTLRIPHFQAAGPADALVVADATWKKLVLEVGWPEHRVEVGEWPTARESFPAEAMPSPLQPHVALIAETRPIELPKVVEDFSSHRLLWEFIQADLEKNPLRINRGIDAYLTEGMRRFQIAEQGFEKRIFIELLIVPAYQQGLARTLIAAGVPVRLWGGGWEKIGEFRDQSGGLVSSRAALTRIAGDSAAIVHPLPGGSAHPVDGLARPVIRPEESQKEFVAICRKAVEGGKIPIFRRSDVITGAKIVELIQRMRRG
jgi:hypothetical protein